MLIGVDGTCWANERGYGRFAREIVSAMVRRTPASHFRVFVDAASAGRLQLELPNVEYVHVSTSRSASSAASAAGYRLPADMLAMTMAVARNKSEVFFSPSVYTYFPLPPRTRAVITIHDAIAERFPSLTVPSFRARTFWALKLKLALSQATRILTVSDYSARDIARVHRIPRSKIDVATEAAAESFQPRGRSDIDAEAARLELPPGARWFIYVGGFNPHKNIESIIRSHAAVAACLGANAPHLLLVGTLDKDVFYGDLAGAKSSIESAGTSDLVHWTGFIPDDRLSVLNSGAIALVLPSAAEGFGLPAVEAAACGTPVIATVESPLPELLAGGGIFVAPGDDDALTKAMLKLATNESFRESCARTALAAARRLTWDECAASAMASLESAFAEPR